MGRTTAVMLGLNLSLISLSGCLALAQDDVGTEVLTVGKPRLPSTFQQGTAGFQLPSANLGDLRLAPLPPSSTHPGNTPTISGGWLSLDDPPAAQPPADEMPITPTDRDSILPPGGPGVILTIPFGKDQ